MIVKILAKTEAEAVLEAKKKSAAHPGQLYLFYCVRGQEYSISEIETPYAPIFAGGYVPTMIASFIKGREFNNHTGKAL